MIVRRPFDDLFDNFRQYIEDAFFAPFIPPIGSKLTRVMESVETCTPLCDVIDKGDKYIVSLEVPGIQKDKIEVKATDEYITIVGAEEKKIKRKKKIMFLMKELIDHSLERYLFQKILYLLKLTLRQKMAF